MRWLALVLVTACGRVGFEPAAPIDATGDTEAPAQGCVAGAATACPVGAMLCDDYENSSGSTFPRWTNVLLANWDTGGAADPGTQLTAGSVECRGDTALHVHTIGEAQVAALALDMTARPNPMYVRTWFRIASTSPPDQFEIVGLRNNASSEFIDLRVDPSLDTFALNVNGFSSTIHMMSGPAAFAVDRWMCVELGVFFDAGTAGSITVALDGTPAFDLSNARTEGSAAFDRTILGAISQLGTTGAFDVDFDETVVSTLPIGCN